MFDVAIIGAGPGGYVCAIKAGQLGLKVVCIESRKTLGGTCLNVGCIPSKTLLEFSEKYHASKHLIEDGLFSGQVSCNFPKLMEKKSSIISQLTGGIAMLFKKNKVSHIQGYASFKDKNTVIVKKEDGTTEEIQAKNFVIATGSEVTPLPNVEIDEEKIVSSTGALELKSVPKKIVVIGAGVIGLELGSVYNRLGSEVEVVEFLPKITPTMDEEISKSFKKVLEKQGLKFTMESKVIGVEKTKTGVNVQVESVKDGAKSVIEADVVLVAIGRRAFTKGLNLEAVGVTPNKRGVIEVNTKFQTAVANIYAIGDVTPGPMLAHKAEDEGLALAEILAGKYGHVNYDVIPSVVYTHPEVASVGKTEEELKAAGVEYKVGKFNMMANSRAKAVDDTEGFVKILACKKTDKVLGCHIISRGAGDIIHEVVVAMEFYGSAEDIARTCHAHPTLNEAIKEAAMAVDKAQIHS
ncbi:MAG: dihydrolipoyl dehydrogenase [Proteobacteria bacterium]|nr:dihydrolipoyl dehydrogenase [Pseudomonadota bacterium]